MSYDQLLTDGSEFRLEFSEPLDNTGSQARDAVKAAVLATLQMLDPNVTGNDVTVSTPDGIVYQVKYDSSVVGGSAAGSLDISTEPVITIPIGGVSDEEGHANTAVIQFVILEEAV